MPFFVVTWMLGVGILALRLAGGWLWMQRMKSHGAVPADAALQAIVKRLSRTLHIARTITLLRSPAVDVPTVIGWLRPTVLLPMSALSGLSPLQVEAILAHELAHVRRHDYFVNLLQTLLETLLFYHPAVWWVSGQIRTERENCCDDLAVSLCGDPVVYASALADLEELRGPASPLVMAANGGVLLKRVKRLLTGPVQHAGRGPAWLAAMGAALLMLVLAGGMIGRQSLRAESG
jgi:beta-lactamase regulating signal transducer with metallopeptidase domain